MSISAGEFGEACQDLARIFGVLTSNGEFSTVGQWESVHTITARPGPDFLRIVRRLTEPVPAQLSSDVEFDSSKTDDAITDDLDDDKYNDPEALAHAALPAGHMHIRVRYDLIYSISYQAPVIYIAFETITGRPMPCTLTDVYRHLVHHEHEGPLRVAPGNNAPFGAISLSDHPVSNTPAYFVHPCQTNEAMRDVQEIASPPPLLWLARFIGLIGSSVGLSLPLSIAQEILQGNNAVEDEKIES